MSSVTPHVMIKNGGCYRELLSNVVENLLVAGRLITTDRTVHNSTRNTVICMAEWQATGTTAALCVKPSSIGAGIIRQILKEDGANLGEE